MSIPDAPWIEYADTNGVPPRSHYYQSGCEDCERGEVYYDDYYDEEDEKEEEEDDEDEMDEIW